jgi:hypothetical protein
MKRIQSAALILALLLAGCAQPEYRPYLGNAVRTGTGGTLRKVYGMDVWNGEPPRKVQILGTFTDTGGGFSNETTLLERIVPAARAKGADALVILEAGREVTGVDRERGVYLHRSHTTVAAIKYL